MRLTISEAVRSKSFDSDPLGWSYTDHSTRRDFWSTRNTVPFVRPNVEFCAGLCNLVSVSINGSTPGLAVVSSFFGAGGGATFLTGSGFGLISSSCDSNVSPIWSVSTASASFGSVTTRNTPPLVNRFARYWSSPLRIGRIYTERTPARSAAKLNALQDNKKIQNRFIPLMISAHIVTRGARGALWARECSVHTLKHFCTTIHQILRLPRRFFVGQVVNLRPIGNRPAGSGHHSQGRLRSVCGLPRCGAGCQPAADCQSAFLMRLKSSFPAPAVFCRKRRSLQGSSQTRVNASISQPLSRYSRGSVQSFQRATETHV